MDVPKPTDLDRSRFTALVPNDPRVAIKPMFGNLGAFVNGNMFAGLFGSSIGVKLHPDDHAELTALGGGQFGPAERPMSGYVTLPVDWRSDGAATGSWIAKALGHVGALPAKAPKPKKATKAGGRPS